MCMQVQEELQRRLQEAPYFAVSLDEASAIGHTQWLSIHMYILEKGMIR